MPATAAVSVLALAAFVPVYFVWLGVDHIAELPPRGLVPRALGQGGLAGVVLMLVYSRAIVLLGAARAALFPSLVPVLAILIGVPLTGEVPDTVQWAGLTLVTAGLSWPPMFCGGAEHVKTEPGGAVPDHRHPL